MERIKMTDRGQVLNIEVIPGKQYTRADFEELAKEHPEIKAMIEYADKYDLDIEDRIQMVVNSGFHLAGIETLSGILDCNGLGYGTTEDGGFWVE